ncbi:squalene epoxidase-domain-containing protein [Lipomyces tetrasporus]|uniref:Squalene monooxygenase n=1 Tax=Lipomyces tetrasporus TaxID=54092 RepID=A0AAD7QUR7_9ASCO|nr:squalene epoxidase-domain-containing protein [Lipomyces tetrasporus]KAJ8101855.1 squalene epoxidase-domain-containing protein [Lipomyces tetrasporus]
MTEPIASQYDVVIVGAGVVGSALGATFGRQGRRVLLIERDWAEPDRIVGELLQPGGVRALEKLGLRQCLEDIDAINVVGYAISYHGENVSIAYASDHNAPEKTLEGRSFHHGRFVSKLREAAKNSPNVTVLEATVNEIISDKVTSQILGVRCSNRKTELSEYYYGALTVVADGTFSKFRRDYISTPVQIRSHFVGIVLKDAVLPTPRHGHVILGDHPPILVYQIGSNETRMLVDVQGKLPSAANGDLKRHLEGVVSASIPACLLPSFKAAMQTERLRSMPNSYLPPSANDTHGLLLLGDAYNMRHPLTGGGMTVALNDIVLISDLLSPARVPSFDDTNLVVSQLNEFYWKRKNLSTVINILAQALYALFAANDSRLRRLQNGCFRYFQRGGIYVSEPIGLLSGILPVPFLLISHFFQVALYSIYVLFQDATWSQYPALTVESVSVFWKACLVVLPMLWSEWR